MLQALSPQTQRWARIRADRLQFFFSLSRAQTGLIFSVLAPTGQIFFSLNSDRLDFLFMSNLRQVGQMPRLAKTVMYALLARPNAEVDRHPESATVLR